MFEHITQTHSALGFADGEYNFRAQIHLEMLTAGFVCVCVAGVQVYLYA